MKSASPKQRLCCVCRSTDVISCFRLIIFTIGLNQRQRQGFSFGKLRIVLLCTREQCKRFCWLIFIEFCLNDADLCWGLKEKKSNDCVHKSWQLHLNTRTLYCIKQISFTWNLLSLVSSPFHWICDMCLMSLLQLKFDEFQGICFSFFFLYF